MRSRSSKAKARTDAHRRGRGPARTSRAARSRRCSTISNGGPTSSAAAIATTGAACSSTSRRPRKQSSTKRCRRFRVLATQITERIGVERQQVLLDVLDDVREAVLALPADLPATPATTPRTLDTLAHRLQRGWRCPTRAHRDSRATKGGESPGTRTPEPTALPALSQYPARTEPGKAWHKCRSGIRATRPRVPLNGLAWLPSRPSQKLSATSFDQVLSSVSSSRGLSDSLCKRS